MGGETTRSARTLRGRDAAHPSGGNAFRLTHVLASAFGYRSRGYHSIERYNDNPYARLWFAKELPKVDENPP